MGYGGSGIVGYRGSVVPRQLASGYWGGGVSG